MSASSPSSAPAWIEDLLRGPVAPRCDDVATWWTHHRDRARRPPASSSIDQAIAGGIAADRVSWAFASAYQAALRAMVPSLPEDRVCALCVTEAGGTSPRAMQSTLTRDDAGWRLDGAKQWTTLGPGAGLLLVAAREAGTPTERNVIRVAQVPADATGVTVLPMPPTAFVPEVPHARLKFDGVRLDAGAVLTGDGYADYVKPFRSIEDLHVHAAILAYLARESRRLDWPRAWTERALAGLLAFAAIAPLDPSASSTHLLLAGAMAQGEALVREAETWWPQAADRDAAARWQRDRPLLGLASKPRELRAQKAWELAVTPGATSSSSSA